ncbi:hypothetical protein RCH06_000606 [Polaromonas sp. CG_9.5]|nr:hypothetical protein [Polaromonas sp. CG_9.5]
MTIHDLAIAIAIAIAIVKSGPSASQPVCNI